MKTKNIFALLGGLPAPLALWLFPVILREITTQSEDFVIEMMSKEAPTLHKWLKGAFIWEESELGGLFWARVYDKLEQDDEFGLFLLIKEQLDNEKQSADRN